MGTDTEKNPVIGGIGLEKTFKDFWGRKKVAALKNVDITVKDGSVFGLLGPNGAGKSTLIKLILGHLYPTRGRLSVLGKSPRDVSIKQRIGYLPERSYLYANLTAAETLSYFGAILDLSKDQIASRSAQLLEMVGLETVRNRRIGEFSHGMTRRMGLAQALLNDPELLILDEPTAGLDPVGCREVKDLIVTLGKRGKTILLTSHLLADVEDVCDEILLLYGGTVQSCGSVTDLLQDHEKTCLEFPKVSEQALASAMNILTEEIPRDSVSVSSPSESLEAHFLKVVAKSNAENRETAGARMGKGVAEYLQDNDYETRYHTDPAAAAETAAVTNRIDPNSKLSELTRDAKAKHENLTGDQTETPDHEALQYLVEPGPEPSAITTHEEGIRKNVLDKLADDGEN